MVKKPTSKEKTGKEKSAKDVQKDSKQDGQPSSKLTATGRKFNIIIWGASGFTGELVCKQLAALYQGQVQWAIAGRSEGKLQKLRTELTKIHGSCKEVPILTADINDPKSLDKMAKQSDVIVSTAGPFWSIGYPVVEAAVRNGTHYCDIAGEVHFIRKTIETLHATAASRNVKVVHSCGFDSVPSDLGTHMLIDHMRTKLSRSPSRINLLVNDIKGAQSGGSLQSMFEQYMLPPEEMQRCEDPFCLDDTPSQPVGNTSNSSTREVVPHSDSKARTQQRRSPVSEETDQFGVRYNKLLNKWTYPFQFSPVNSRIVRRTSSLVGKSRAFKYSEAHEAEGPIDAMLGAFGHTLVHLVATVPIIRAIVSPMLPKPGDGPPEAFRERNHWKFTLYGWTEEGKDRSKQCQAVVSGRRDPGYLETSRMALEAGLCLALQGEELKERGMRQGGVLTPASAMGSVLTERLKAANIQFEITKTGREVPSSPLHKLKAGTSSAKSSSPSSNERNSAGAKQDHAWRGPNPIQFCSNKIKILHSRSHTCITSLLQEITQGNSSPVHSICSKCKGSVSAIAHAVQKQHQLMESKAVTLQQQVSMHVGQVRQQFVDSIH